jgi:hypothetical protein
MRPLKQLLPPLHGIAMAQSVLVELTLPKDWQAFRLPPALDDRLQELLDRQDREGKLSRRERREARALTELVDMLSLLKAQAHQSGAKSVS